MFYIVLVLSRFLPADGEKKEQNKDAAYGLIVAYIMAALLSFHFVAWALCITIHNWRARKLHVPLPELLGRQRLETEEELDGVAEPQETVLLRDTEPRIEAERPNHLPIVAHDPEVLRYVFREGHYIGMLEIIVHETDTNPALNRHQAYGARHRQDLIAGRPPVRHPPMPGNIYRARILNQYIFDLGRRIYHLQKAIARIQRHHTLDSFTHGIHGARAIRDRPTPTQGRPQSNQSNQLPNRAQNTYDRSDPRPIVIPGIRLFDTAEVMNAVDSLHCLATEGLQSYLDTVKYCSGHLNYDPFMRTVNGFRRLFQELRIIRSALVHTNEALEIYVQDLQCRSEDMNRTNNKRISGNVIVFQHSIRRLSNIAESLVYRARMGS